MQQAKKNTLSSLSGLPVKDDAMRGLATGNRTGKPAAREQTILTPISVLNVCHVLWGCIALDPCAIAERWFAKKNYVFPQQDGLTSKWIPKTFINPPYKNLKDWLKYGQTQPREQVWLVPVRTHRVWFREWRDQLDGYMELDPLKFVGFDQAFPAPLMLGYVGDLNFSYAAFMSGLKGGLYCK